LKFNGHNDFRTDFIGIGIIQNQRKRPGLIDDYYVSP
jgi:hypothetical protein